MKQHIDMIVMLVVAFLLFTKPTVLVNFANSIVGKLVLVGSMLFALRHSTLSGIFIALLFVLLMEEVIEGLSTIVPTTNQDTINAAEKEFDEQYNRHLDMREKNCVAPNPGEAATVFIDNEGKKITLDEMAKKFPYQFTKDYGICNPCADALQGEGICPFKINSTVEQFAIMEELKPISGKKHIPHRAGNATPSTEEEE
jgi:hypothetical protein